MKGSCISDTKRIVHVFVTVKVVCATRPYSDRFFYVQDIEGMQGSLGQGPIASGLR